MIEVTRQSENYRPDMVRKRYAARHGQAATYLWIEVGDNRRFNIREGKCDGRDLPRYVREAADDRRARGVWPFWVEWPL